jgi:hypothetical protein
MLGKIFENYQSGHLLPLPAHIFQFDQAAEAYRFMAQAKHIGKVVITSPSWDRIRKEAKERVDWRQILREAANISDAAAIAQLKTKHP